MIIDGRGAIPVLSTILFLVGCAPGNAPGEPTGTAELRVDPESVEPGGEVLLTLVNRSDDPMGYNLCVAVLERREGGEWVEWPERPTEVCTMELRILDPEESGSFRHTLPGRVPAGEYRFRTGVEAPLGEDRVEVASEIFRVVI